MTEDQIKAEKILDSWQAFRDQQYLREMNGRKCGTRQGNMLSSYNWPAKQFQQNPRQKNP